MPRDPGRTEAPPIHVAADAAARRQYPGQLADEGRAGVRAAYGDHLDRLIALEDRYDPANGFRLNANILPSDAAATASV